MTLNDLIKAIETLSWEELDQLQNQIVIRRQKQTQQQIAKILEDAKPVELVAGTMDVDKLTAALAAMRAGLTERELNEIADAMDDEYIEPDNTLHG